jgi:hypothetical protein
MWAIVRQQGEMVHVLAVFPTRAEATAAAPAFRSRKGRYANVPVSLWHMQECGQAA